MTPSFQETVRSLLGRRPGGHSENRATIVLAFDRSGFGRGVFFLLLLLVMASVPTPAQAARVGDVVETGVVQQAIRFFTFRDPSVRYALLGAVLIGVSTGLLGSFIVVRRMAMAGDALSHAVLPGVALGFLWNMSKDPMAIFVGATLAGLLGTAFVSWITSTTRIKEDAALGMVLAGFFSIGLCLMSMIQGLPTGNKSGINSFIFGQAAAIGPTDLKLMAIVTVGAVLGVALFYRQLLVTSFDPGFARASGLPVRWVHHGLMLFLAFAVVIALQAVGVVLVSALLIIPAATAYLLTDRMHRMLAIAVAAGVAAGVAGSFVSFLAPALPTGPFIVLASASLFGVAFLFSPRQGLLLRWWHQRSRNARVACENTLKAIYHLSEAHGFKGEGALVRELAERRRSTLEEELVRIRSLVAAGWATLSDDRAVVYPTPGGWQRASEIVRNHRLWELYLTNAAQISPDHVHEDAEKIEHVLGEELVRELERRLQFATVDPHGKAIPAIGEIRGTAPSRGDTTIGFRRSGP